MQKAESRTNKSAEDKKRSQLNKKTWNNKVDTESSAFLEKLFGFDISASSNFVLGNYQRACSSRNRCTRQRIKVALGKRSYVLSVESNRSLVEQYKLT